MIGIISLARRVCAAIIIAALVSTATATPAGAQDDASVRQFFEESEVIDANNAALFLGMTLEEFAQSATEVHYFLLAIGQRLGANECALGFATSIERHSGRTQIWIGYPADVAEKFGAISAHYCTDEFQTQRLNLALLTFLAGANAASTGSALAMSGLPVHQQRTNGFDPTPAQGWQGHFAAELTRLRDLDASTLGGCDSAGADALQADLTTLFYDSWAHATAPVADLRDHVGNVFGQADLRNAAVCQGNADAVLSHTGGMRYHALVAHAYYGGGAGWSAPTGPLFDHEVERPGRLGETVWDAIGELVVAMFDPGDDGLHTGACWSIDTSSYNQRAQDLIGWQVAIDSYLTTNVVVGLDRDGLVRVRDLLVEIGAALTGIHNARCRPPVDGAATLELLSPLGDLLFEIATLMNVGYTPTS